MPEETAMAIGCELYAPIHTLRIIQSAKPFKHILFVSIQVRERKPLKNSEAQV